MPLYPVRHACFAHRFVRLLQKSCAAMDIGQNACLLLCYIAHTEDAARYSGPVRFWNEQLLTTLAFSPRQLRAARDKAIEAGWLHYDRESDRSVGRYFVLVPRHLEEISDGVIESLEPLSGAPSGADLNQKEYQEKRAKRFSGADSTPRSVPGTVPEVVPGTVPPSNPNPFPDPKTQTQGTLVASSVRQDQSVNASDAASVNAPLRRSTGKQERFVKPSVCDVAAYVAEINATVDARQFCDFYESNGWKVGRNPMRDWRATVRQWESRKLEGRHYGHGQKSQAASREQANADTFAVALAAAEATNVALGRIGHG